MTTATRTPDQIRAEFQAKIQGLVGPTVETTLSTVQFSICGDKAAVTRAAGILVRCPAWELTSLITYEDDEDFTVAVFRFLD